MWQVRGVMDMEEVDEGFAEGNNMIPLLEEHRADIAALCEKFHVVRLEVFGSAAMGNFDEARSDVDFLVEFDRLEPRNLANAYFGLLAELENLFHRKVDLVTPKAIRNPYFLRGVNETRQVFYAA